MAINIFQGSKPTKGGGRTSTSSSSVRAKNAQAALTTPSVTSDSGATAVGKSGTLAKVGNVVGKVAGLASKFLPGIGGTIAKGISNIFNDPEWWMSVPGDAVTLNTPLRTTKVNHDSDTTLYKERFAIGEFVTALTPNVTPPPGYPPVEGFKIVIEPSEQAVTQYLLPEIRKVVNAVPLQSALSYSKVLACNATVYALWQTLKKFDYMLKHGQTYMASLNDSGFPILQVVNAARLQSMIGRLEEYLRANVRLPHTLCEYLAWRFGRVYKSCNSAKAALIMYNVLDLQAPMQTYDDYIQWLMNEVASTAETQQANADLYNAYFDHDFMVEVREDTQFKFDAKEFCLRTNLDLFRYADPDADLEELDVVYLDSALDNPTTFMASTVSTRGSNAAGSYNTFGCLFPVYTCFAHIPGETGWGAKCTLGNLPTEAGNTDFLIREADDSLWYRGELKPAYGNTASHHWTVTDVLALLGSAILCKSLDIYNKDIYGPVCFNPGATTPRLDNIDFTSLSMDMGVVQNTTLTNEQVYAFANLVHVGRKHSMSYKEAETLVARDTANLVERLDIGQSK